MESDASSLSFDAYLKINQTKKIAVSVRTGNADWSMGEGLGHLHIPRIKHLALYRLCSKHTYQMQLLSLGSCETICVALC